jgi:hypothetical protein
LNILSIDNSYGEMPDACVNEPLPHLLKAEKDAADEPAPLVWVYPMREYTTSMDADLLREMNLCDNYICDAVNDGLPLCCVVSTDNFLCHETALYRKNVLLSPVPENPSVLQKLFAAAENGCGVLLYGSKEKLSRVPDCRNVIKLDAEETASRCREALAQFGYVFRFQMKATGTKPPTMAVTRHDNGWFFSVYNANTTTEAQLRFPLGAPVLCGMETELKDGCSVYRFSRGEHRECRVFVQQQDGVVSCREAPPVNMRFRRAVRICGLKDATVWLFSEKGCASAVSIAKNTDVTPEFDPRFRTVQDAVHGEYLLGEHVTGDIYFLMERKK